MAVGRKQDQPREEMWSCLAFCGEAERRHLWAFTGLSKTQKRVKMLLEMIMSLSYDQVVEREACRSSRHLGGHEEEQDSWSRHPCTPTRRLGIRASHQGVNKINSYNVLD